MKIRRLIARAGARFNRKLPVAALVGRALVPAVLAGCFRSPLVPLAGPPPAFVAAGVPGVSDQRARFREIYCAIRADHGRTLPDDRPCDDALVTLPPEPPPSGRPVALGPATSSLRILVVGGFAAECFSRWATAFSDGRAHLETHGYRTGIIPVSGMSSTQHNARQIRAAILRTALAEGERIVLVAHSKGAADSLQALADFPEIVPRVAALVSVAGAVGGSPLADGMRSGMTRLLRALDVRRCDPGDHGGIESLRRSTRAAFLAATTLPPSVKYFSVGGIVSTDETSAPLRPFQRQLAEIDARNDGQVLAIDTVIPGGALLGFARADHWAIAIPFSRTAPAPVRAVIGRHNAFPREVLLEAIVRSVEEAL
jgi:hypothetical protein